MVGNKTIPSQLLVRSTLWQKDPEEQVLETKVLTSDLSRFSQGFILPVLSLSSSGFDGRGTSDLSPPHLCGMIPFKIF